MARAIWPGVIRRKGAASGWNQRRGWGSKLTTPSGAAIARAARPAAAMTAWCPRCTPSKAPMATAAPFSSGGRSRQSVTISTKSVLCGTAAAGHADDRDAVHDQLVVDEALAVQLDAGAFLIDGDDADAHHHVVAGADRQVESEGLGDVDGPGAGQDGADNGRAERGRQQAVGDAPAVGGLRGEGVVEVDRIEVVRGLGEQADALVRDMDDLFGRHAGVELLEDVAARGMLRDQFHARGLT